MNSEQSKLKVREASLVFTFCHQLVDPDHVSSVLDVRPTFTQRVGEECRYSWNNESYISNVGIWKYVNDEIEALYGLDEQLEEWVRWLTINEKKIEKLVDSDYQPYLSCSSSAVEKNDSVCLGPDLMGKFAFYRVAICIG